MVGQCVRDDDLRFADRSLRIVTLHKDAVSHHDAAIWVGEVALRLLGRLPGGRGRYAVRRQRRGRTTPVGIVVVLPGRELVGLLFGLRRPGARSLALARVERRLGFLPLLGGQFAQASCTSLCGFLLEGCLRLANAAQSGVAPLKFVGQVLRAPVASVLLVLALVGLLRAKQQRLAFGCQTLLVLLHPSVTHGLVLARRWLAPWNRRATRGRRS